MPGRIKLVGQLKSFTGNRLWTFQLILAGIALATSFVFWFFQGAPGFINTFVYTFFIGNFTAACMDLFSGLFNTPSHFRRWLFFLALLVPIGIVGGTIASLIIYSLPTTPHGVPLAGFLVQNVMVGAFITVLSSIPRFIGNNAREHLEAANRLLRDQVQLGSIQLKDQAAELLSAHEIQTHLIPTTFPQIAGLQISGAWQPAQAVGGDYFDVLPFSDTRLGVCIADVSGKGMGAALLMANFQAAFRAFATEDTAPDTLCARLNRALSASIAPGKFVTFFYGIIDMTHLLFDYGNAGHTPPILLRGDTATTLKGGGTVLGLFPHLVYDALTIPLQPGDCLLLTTDGITEAAHPDNLDDEFGDDRLIHCAQSVRSMGAHAIRSRILKEVTNFCDGQFQDDASLIVLTMDAS